MKSAESKVAAVLGVLQVLALAVIVLILRIQIGAGPLVCGALLVAGVFLTFGELRALNYATVRDQPQRPSRRSR